MAFSGRRLCFLLVICGYSIVDNSASTLSNETVEIISLEDSFVDSTTRAPISKGSRIVGGSVANIRDFPYHLSLFRNGTFGCGASIATSRFAITAARCLNSIWKPEEIHLRAGNDQRTTGFGYIHRVKNLFVHPRYKSNLQGYDVALVEVWNRFRWLPTVAPVKLPPPGFVVPNGAVANLSGFGVTGSGTLSDVLMYARLTVLLHEQCLKLIPWMTRTRDICAGTNTTNGRNGDVGGALVLNGVQLGVFVWINTENGVGGFTNLADEVTHAWILSHVY